MSRFIDATDKIILAQWLGQRSTKIILAATLILFIFLIIAWHNYSTHYPSMSASPLPDFNTYANVTERKTAFYAYLTPIIGQENKQIIQRRHRLLAITESFTKTQRISWWNKRWLRKLAQHYDVKWDLKDTLKNLNQLSRRVDSIPIALALVQAAKESGWGRSRFAVQGNNLFGQWCYTQGCGIVPSNRSARAKHEVTVFPSVETSVRSYLHNLNTHNRYQKFRILRQQMRQRGTEPSALALADELLFYSQRRQSYVDEVKAMIRHYQRDNKPKPPKTT